MKGFLENYLNKNLFKYLGIGYFSTFLSMFINIILIKLLSSYELGRISIGKSIFQSFEYSHFGLRFGLDRILPHQKTEQKRNEYFRAVYLFSVITSSIFTIFWILYDTSDWKFYLFFSFSGIFYTLITITKVYYRSFENKAVFINLSFWIQLFPLIIQLLGLYFFGTYGFVIGHLISYVLVFFISVFFYKIDVWSLDKNLLSHTKELFSYGGLLFISSIINFLSITGDRFLIAKYMGLQKVGEFSVIMFFFSALTMFSASYTELILNKIIVNPSFQYLKRQILFIVVVAFTLVIICYPILPYFVEVFIPKYTPLSSSIQTISIASIPYACLPILNNFMHGIDKRKVLLFVNLLATVIYFVGLFYILHFYKDFDQLIIWKLISTIILVLLTLGIFIYYSKIVKSK